MPRAYLVVSYHSISDLKTLAAYGTLTATATAFFAGRFLARGDAVATHERGLAERLTIVEFPSVEKAITFRESRIHQEALRALGDDVVHHVRIVEGLE